MLEAFASMVKAAGEGCAPKKNAGRFWHPASRFEREKV